jgi:hypothetical protein
MLQYRVNSLETAMEFPFPSVARLSSAVEAALHPKIALQPCQKTFTSKFFSFSLVTDPDDQILFQVRWATS